MNPTISLRSSPPKQLDLSAGQLHLWRFRLNLPPAAVAELTPLLTTDEQARAERLLDRSKAEHFIAARARTRQILGRYLDRKPEDITFTYGEHGKPGLSETAEDSLTFNLSHAGDWGLLAVTSGTNVGVDIEQVDPQLDYMKIASGFFNPDEIDELGKFPRARQRRAFYRIWTRKEACLKGEGFGFSSPHKINRNARWQIRSFSVARGYLGAVAVVENVDTILRWDLD